MQSYSARCTALDDESRLLDLLMVILFRMVVIKVGEIPMLWQQEMQHIDAQIDHQHV